MSRWCGSIPAFACLVACGGALSACTPAAARHEAPSPAEAPLLAAPAPRDDGRLPEGARPRAYRLTFTIDPRAPTFHGDVEIDVQLERPDRFLVLHGRGLRIASVDALTASGRTLSVKAAPREAAHAKGEAEELVLTASEEFPAGVTTLRFAYEAPFAEKLRGIYRVEEGGDAYAFSQFEPTDSRLSFPCFDEPGFKVPVTLRVITPEANSVFANMPERARQPGPSAGLVTVDFQPSPPLPTYLVALAVGPFDVKKGPDRPTPLGLVAVKGRAELGELARETAAAHLGVLERYFRTPYPYPKLDLVAVPNFSAGAMENPGLVTFREERLLVDPKNASVSSRLALTGVIAHELSHMWFGDLVTMRWWDDLWLNEGFATWMAAHVLDEWKPELGAGADALGGAARAMEVDTLSSSRTIRQPVRSTSEAQEAFDGITYQKAAGVLYMAEQWLGPGVFQSGIITYLGRHRNGNATADELFGALRQASGQDVAAVMHTFTDQTGVPGVDVALECRSGDGARPVLKLSQSEYRPLGSSGAGSKLWRFPVCARYDTGAAPGRKCTLFDAREKTLELDAAKCPAWVVSNAEQAGYYHSKRPYAALQALASLAPGVLTGRERVGVLLDARADVESGGLPAASYLELARRFRDDAEHAVWAEIAAFLEFAWLEVVPEADAPAFARYVRDLAGPMARRLGWERRPKDGENEETLRRTVLGLLGEQGADPDTLARARKTTDQWLAAPGTVHGDLAAVAVPLAAAHGDAALYDRFEARLRAPGTPEDRLLALAGLGSFTEPVLVDRTMSLVLSGAIRTQDQIYVVRRLFRVPKVRAHAFAAFAEHADAVLAKLPVYTVPRFVGHVASACSAEEASRAEAVFRPRLSRLEGADRALEQAVESAHRCAAFREHHAGALSTWLTAAR